jgi:hypothetical protein
MNLKVKQSVTPHDEGRWNWSLWLDGPEEELDEIEYVEYILHPTFPKPVQKISDRSTNFRFDARGWGEFSVKVRVHREDDDEVIVLDHWLELDEVAPTRSGEAFSIKEEKLRLYLSSGVADIEFAYELKEALEHDGVDVLLKEDMSYAQSLESILETQRRSIQAGLFVISDVRNPWLIRDYWVLAEHKISSLVVQIGEPRELPDELNGLPRFQVKDVSEADQVASSIARRMREQL